MTLRPNSPDGIDQAWTCQGVLGRQTGIYRAEGVGFEPTVGCPTSVFKTDLIGLSSIPPKVILLIKADEILAVGRNLIFEHKLHVRPLHDDERVWKCREFGLHFDRSRTP